MSCLTRVTLEYANEHDGQHHFVRCFERRRIAGGLDSLVRFIASDESAYMTGQVIGINGGMHW